MPRNETHSGMKKRFRVAGGGKLVREQADKRHLLEHKSSRRTRRLVMDQLADVVDLKSVRCLLGR